MPNALRLPVYPLFVVLTSGGARPEMLWLTILCQIVIDSLFAVFLINCVSRLFPDKLIGSIAGVVYACNPDAAFLSTQLLAENISFWLIAGALFGLAAAMELDKCDSRWRFGLGVLCASLLPLCKPIWQYLWLLFLAWIVLAMVRSRSRAVLCWLLAGWLVVALPGLLWMKRNYDAWGIFTLSVSKPYVEWEAAKGILRWADPSLEAALPGYTKEMTLHLLRPDFSRPDAMPEEFMKVTSWDRNGIVSDYRRGHALYSALRSQYWAICLKQHVAGTAYLLFSPGTNYLRRFMGLNPLSEEHFGFIGQSHLGSWDKFIQFLRPSLTAPGGILWTVAVLGFLSFYYLSVIGGLVYWWKNYRWHIWTLFLVGGGAFVFLLGPVGSSRYRFVLIQAFLPLACVGILRWKRRLLRRSVENGA